MKKLIISIYTILFITFYIVISKGFYKNIKEVCSSTENALKWSLFKGKTNRLIFPSCLYKQLNNNNDTVLKSWLVFFLKKSINNNSFKNALPESATCLYTYKIINSKYWKILMSQNSFFTKIILFFFLGILLMIIIIFFVNARNKNSGQNTLYNV